jgi:hypothetical protein
VGCWCKFADESTSKILPARKLKASLCPVANNVLYKNLSLRHGTRDNNWPILNLRMTAHLLIATRFPVYHSVSIQSFMFLPDDWERFLNVRVTTGSKATRQLQSPYSAVKFHLHRGKQFVRKKVCTNVGFSTYH